MDKESIIDLAAVSTAISKTNANTTKLKDIVNKYQKYLDNAYEVGSPVQDLLNLRAEVVDRVLGYLWGYYFKDTNEVCLIAVGGYGRKILFPHSDIDILILFSSKLTSAQIKYLSTFITKIWDIGLNIGHGTRSIKECLTLAKTDLCIYTNLLEARFIVGDSLCFSNFHLNFNKATSWTDKGFYEAKAQEQQQRHQRFNETAYRLEPDVKNSPGALRDLHHLKWLCLKFFQTGNFNVLLSKNILTEMDLAILLTCEDYLLNLRYALHLINKKDDNRLLFDRQLELSKYFKYKDSKSKFAIEAFMKDYFLKIKEILALCEIVLQYFYEIVYTETIKTQTLTEHFLLKNTFIQLENTVDIKLYPEILIGAFTQLSMTPSASGFCFKTLYLLRQHLYLIDDAFRASKKNHELFIQLFKEGKQISLTLQLMTRHDVLGRYFPEFGHIIGQTQHDLFHLYTVDQHTLFVIKKIDSLKMSNELYGTLFKQLSKPELLYLAAFFHDIGKGRRTDHSIYGAKSAIKFCKEHGLSSEDSQLITWLVSQHLFMSQTAQKQDLNDIEVIEKFTAKVKTLNRLNFLFLLTIADIQATNESLWNSWRDALLRQLYFAAKKQLKARKKHLSLQEQVNQKQQNALELLLNQGIEREKIFDLWHQLGTDYFLKESAEHISWHSSKLIEYGFDENKSLVSIQNHKPYGATEIFVCSKDRDNLFLYTVLALDRLLLNIVEARITTSSNDFSLNTYSVLDQNNTMITNAHELQRINTALQDILAPNITTFKCLNRRISRQLAHFCGEASIHFKNTPSKQWTRLSINAPDRPGLLSRIGLAFYKQQIRVHRAKITTLGDQVDDVFYISDKENNPLKSRKQQIELLKSIKKEISL